MTWVALTALTACSSVQDEIERLPASAVTSAAVSGGGYVEAFIEYAGPAERWGGPEPLVVQFSARDSGRAFSLLSTPAWSKNTPIENSHSRAPASAHRDDPVAHPAVDGEGTVWKAWNPARLKERLAALAEAVESTKIPSQAGCLYPVRVRLLRGDGGVVEKGGCRSSRGWVKMASSLVADAFQ
jgi:hypothetical protein